MTIKLYEVGGCVRDRLLGVKSKDIDYSVEVDTTGDWDGEIDTDIAFAKMRQFLKDRQFEIFVESPQYFTIRARFPKSRETADFVLCRKEGPYTDGRRPDWVRVGTLADDLDRRDFTVNALAVPMDSSGHAIGEVIDRHDGLFDLKIRRLRFVGDPMDRLREDALRIMRALRFVITKDFTPNVDILAALRGTDGNDELPGLLAAISIERRREELERCLWFDTMKTLDWIMTMLSDEMREAMFSGGLRLSATMKQGVTRV